MGFSVIYYLFLVEFIVILYQFLVSFIIYYYLFLVIFIIIYYLFLVGFAIIYYQFQWGLLLFIIIRSGSCGAVVAFVPLFVAPVPNLPSFNGPVNPLLFIKIIPNYY